MLLQFNETTMYKDLLDNATNTNQQLKGNWTPSVVILNWNRFINKN